MGTKVVNKYKEPFDVYIGRGSMFGNPYVVGKDGNREQVVEKYRTWFSKRLKDRAFKTAISNLKGKRLGCFCAPLLCHGDIIVQYLDEH